MTKLVNQIKTFIDKEKADGNLDRATERLYNVVKDRADKLDLRDPGDVRSFLTSGAVRQFLSTLPDKNLAVVVRENPGLGYENLLPPAYQQQHNPGQQPGQQPGFNPRLNPGQYYPTNYNNAIQQIRNGNGLFDLIQGRTNPQMQQEFNQVFGVSKAALNTGLDLAEGLMGFSKNGGKHGWASSIAGLMASIAMLSGKGPMGAGMTFLKFFIGISLVTALFSQISGSSPDQSLAHQQQPVEYNRPADVGTPPPVSQEQDVTV